jgi:pimeloyl-ACP methyl ester carboxylesterase
LLDCPESDSLLDQTLANDLDTAQINQLTFEAYESCRMRLEKEGISLAAYTTAASADDVRDIISALGYSKVYLLGLSYGTRLAQVTLLRHQDEGWIEGVILDSPVPLQVADRLSFWPNTQAAFQHIFDRCAAESDCAAHFPDLKETFIATMDALHATPLEVETFHPVTGRAITIQVNDVAFYEVFFAMLYGREKTAKIPALIQQVNQRETELLAEAFSEFFAYVQVVDEGMNLAVNCADEGYEIDLAAIEQTNATLDPVFARLAEGDAATAQRICLAWGAQPPDPAENQPLQTDLPILILAGDQDPITPAAWGELLHEAMPTSYFYEFAGVGHAVMMTFGKTGLCAETLMRTFLADSTSAPDGACVTTIQPLPFRKP